MSLNQDRIRDLLDRGDFQDLFNKLGWDNPLQPAATVEDSEKGLSARQIAQKRGVGVWLIEGRTRDAAARRILERRISRLNRERLLVVTEGGCTKGGEQIWWWPEQRPSGGYKLVLHRYVPGTRNDDLIQRLSTASFSLSEEDSLTVVQVLARVRHSFSAEKVTKKFYKEFHEHHRRLQENIEGIPEGSKEVSWYCSVLMNRLMLVYFLQKKGFLDDDLYYLRNRLWKFLENPGDDAPCGFFGGFLQALFHEGLGSHENVFSDPDMARLVGNVPYVGGGIFLRHQLEMSYDINIPDAAFESTLKFFDKYQWHLDERPTLKANEINPDVLGYIFEQYVNQKEQGAYYTKGDITGYMAASTIIPAYIDRLSPPEENSPWVLLSADPDRYIHESVRHGAEEWLANSNVNTPPPQKFPTWKDAWESMPEEERFEKAPDFLGLPGESWWETNDRIEHYRRLWKELESNSIADADAAVTANLNLRQLIEDYLSTLGSTLEVENAFGVLADLKILDPTCGSGAFLFATLDVLYEMYLTLIERAEELASSGAPARFLTEAREHPNRDYFILKTTMLRNLYGLDLMPEAAEIARLRLFLKLAAQLDSKEQIEPLPDLDFNIKTGNLLVGIAHKQDAESRLGRDLLGSAKLDKIIATASTFSRTYNEFVEAQKRADNPERVAQLKSDLNQRLTQNRNSLDDLLYKARAEQSSLEEWVGSHSPFHWCIEFPQVQQAGGFDVVIGNPPYISRKKVEGYRWQGYQTGGLPDIYAPCLERALHLVRPAGRFAMILPISFQFGNKYVKARKVAAEALSRLWISTFARGPSQLFHFGIKVRSSIIMGLEGEKEQTRDTSVTRLNRWITEYREHLFPTIRYTRLPSTLAENVDWIRIGSTRQSDLITSLIDQDRTIGSFSSKKGTQELGFKSVAYFFLSTFLEEPPAYSLNKTRIKQSKVSYIEFIDSVSRDAAFAFTLSKIGLLWWAATSDEFDVTKSGLCSMPIPASPEVHAEAATFACELQVILSNNLFYSKAAGAYYGNYDVKAARHITDKVDRLILKSIGMEDYWDDLQLFYATFDKKTGEAATVLRELPD